METGMLWFDNDSKTDLSTKIARAVIYYQKKFGENPDVCYIHPTMLGRSIRRNYDNIEVRPSSVVACNYLWIGIHERTAVSF